MNAAVASAVGDDDSLPRRRCGKYNGIRDALVVLNRLCSPSTGPIDGALLSETFRLLRYLKKRGVEPVFGSNKA